MSESEECRAWTRRGRTTGGSPDVRISDPNDVGGRRRQTRPGRPEGKNFYTHTPARALRREGRPVRPWREAHSLSPCPDGQRLRLRTRKPDPIARVLHPRSDNTRCCPADSSWACPPGSRRIDVYSYKVPARPEAKSALQGRGTVAPAQWWWGHEVLKGPNTLAGVRIFRQNKQQRRARDCRCFPVLFLAARSAVVYRTCKVSAIADAPTTVLRTVPRPCRADFWPCDTDGLNFLSDPLLRPSMTGQSPLPTVIHSVPNFFIRSRITRSMSSVTPEKFCITSRLEYRRTRKPNRSSCLVRSASAFLFSVS